MSTLTAPQLAHLRAAEAGHLHVNDRGGPIRRWVRMDAKVSRAVCERLLEAGLIERVAEPGRAVAFTAAPTDAGRAALAAAGGAP